jgi:transcriptional regulator with XRE-family HTH domain
MEKNIEQRIRIGKEVMQLRARSNLTQQQLSDKSGVTRANISKIEAGRYSVGFDVLQRVAEALDSDIKLVKR